MDFGNDIIKLEGIIREHEQFDKKEWRPDEILSLARLIRNLRNLMKNEKDRQDALIQQSK